MFFMQRNFKHNAIFLGIILLVLTGCGMGQKKMSQAELKYFETRPVDASYTKVYSAAVEAMFDLGYTISHSDKASGIIVGEKRTQKPGVWLYGNIPEGKREEDYYDWLQLTLLVKEESGKKSQVRIKTAINKEIKLDKNAIDEVWVYIQRQVLMESKPAA